MLIEFIDNTSTSVMNTVSAVAEEGPSIDLVMTATSAVIEDNLQMYRLMLAHMSEDTLTSGNKEQIEKSNKMRDLRVFKTITGEDVTDYSGTEFNESFADKDMRRFKQTDDPAEAVKLLPGLIERAIEDANGNPEKLRNELSRIKRNSYQTMPNPESMPKSFLKYLTYLQRVEGPKKAQQRLVDYIQQNQLNQAKSAMIP